MTDSERCDQIVDAITAATVSYALDAGEPWTKQKHIVYIPEEQFKLLRRYHEWEHIPDSVSYGAQIQEVNLPHARVQNGRDAAEIQIMRVRL